MTPFTKLILDLRITWSEFVLLTTWAVIAWLTDQRERVCERLTVDTIKRFPQ